MKKLWSTAQICKVIGLSRQQLLEAVKSGYIEQETRGQYDPVVAVSGYIQHLKRRAGIHQSQELMQARTELALQQARKAKVVADEAEGSVVQVEDVRADMTALLETIAATIKASGISAKQQNDLFKIIREGGEEFDRKYGWND